MKGTPETGGILVGQARIEEDERQAERQIHLLELLGTTLLFEENHLVGFLPLRTYLETKKQLGAGKKCPPEEEDLVRCLLFRDSLERLKCTKADLADKLDKISMPDKGTEESKREASGSKVKDDVNAMDKMFA